MPENQNNSPKNQNNSPKNQNNSQKTQNKKEDLPVNAQALLNKRKSDLLNEAAKAENASNLAKAKLKVFIQTEEEMQQPKKNKSSPAQNRNTLILLAVMLLLIGSVIWYEFNTYKPLLVFIPISAIIGIVAYFYHIKSKQGNKQ